MVKKILVTGGSGYIGARLCLYLADRGYLVTPVCFPEAPADREWVNKMEKVIVGDVRDDAFLNDLSEGAYEVIIHLVSLDHRQSEGPPAFVSAVNVTPVWSLLDIFSKKNLKKFIYFSTVQIYGKLPAEEITENRKPEVQNAYGLTHLLGENICDFYNRTTSVDCRVVRLSNSYGAPVFIENNCWWLVVNDLCRQAYLEKKIVLQSDGTPQRDFIHGWDVCQAVEKIIVAGCSDFLYHISSGETLTIWEIAGYIQMVYQKKYGKLIPITRTQNVPISIIHRYHIDNTQLYKIGFRPEWSLERGITNLFDYIEQNEGK